VPAGASIGGGNRERDGLEPDLVDLAAGSAGDTGLELDLLDPPAPAAAGRLGVAGPAALDDGPRRAAPRLQPEAISAQERERLGFSLPRLPGPHGPRPRVMVIGFLAACAVLVGASAAHVIGERGIEVLTPAGPELAVAGGSTVSDPTAAAASTTAAAPAAAVAPAVEPGRSTATSAAAEPAPAAATAVDTVPSAPAAPIECPADTAVVDAAVCIERGEYPALRRLPRTGVTYEQAAALCEERGRRLCSPSEWERACGGGKGRKLPYGSTVMQGLCNTASIAGFAQNIVLSGMWERCVTPAGVADMVGNVGEWVGDCSVRGGDVSTMEREATCRAVGRPPAGYAGPEVGFRCCLDRDGG
jgi:hypothetical protein